MSARAKVALIVLAGGTGKRFLHKTPKQYHRVFGVPMFVAAIKPFLKVYGRDIAVVIACPAAMKAATERVVRTHIPARVPVITISGGAQRIDSFFNGVRAIAQHFPSVKAVISHDAARPLIHAVDIGGLRATFEKKRPDAAILSSPLTESLFRKARQGALVGVNRDDYCIGESPDIFTIRLAKRMYEKWAHKTPQLHHSVHIIELISREKKYTVLSHERKYPNLKVTHLPDKHLVRSYAKLTKKRS